MLSAKQMACDNVALAEGIGDEMHGPQAQALYRLGVEPYTNLPTRSPAGGTWSCFVTKSP
jgi:hypothetical protein